MIRVKKIDNIRELKIGDIAQNLGSGNAYEVNRITDDGRVFAIREIEISNPSEWALVDVSDPARVKPGLLKSIYQRLIRLWLKLHWRRSIDSAPEEYVKAMEKETDINADWEVTNRMMRRK